MAKCRHCEKSGWTVRTDRFGVCQPCRQHIQLDVTARLERVKQALVYVRCAKDPQAQRSFCDIAIETAESLLPYETRRLTEISPQPSALLDMLRAKRQEALVADSTTAPVPRRLAGGEALLQVLAAPEGRDDPAAADGERPSEAEDQPVLSAGGRDAWWAWSPETTQQFDTALDEAVGAAPEKRRRERAHVHCYALLEPGGVRGVLENLSSGGLFLRAERSLPTGSTLRLIVSTLDGPARAEGVVRWREDGSPPGMGIEFTHVSPELLAYLQLCLGSVGPSFVAESTPAPL